MHLNFPYLVLNNYFYSLFFSSSYFFFFSSRSETKWKNTFVILINIFDYYRFLLLFFYCVRSISNCIWFIELFINLLISVFTNSTRCYFLKFIPVIDNFITTCPSFFCVVKNGLTRMMMTDTLNILLLGIIF